MAIQCTNAYIYRCIFILTDWFNMIILIMQDTAATTREQRGKQVASPAEVPRQLQETIAAIPKPQKADRVARHQSTFSKHSCSMDGDTHTHTHVRTRTHARTHARTHTHTHTHSTSIMDAPALMKTVLEKPLDNALSRSAR